MQKDAFKKKIGGRREIKQGSRHKVGTSQSSMSKAYLGAKNLG